MSQVKNPKLTEENIIVEPARPHGWHVTRPASRSGNSFVTTWHPNEGAARVAKRDLLEAQDCVKIVVVMPKSVHDWLVSSEQAMDFHPDMSVTFGTPEGKAEHGRWEDVR